MGRHAYVQTLEVGRVYSRPVEHIKSSVCTLLCVGPWTCFVTLKQSSSEIKSENVQLLESTLIFKSTSRMVTWSRQR